MNITEIGVLVPIHFQSTMNPSTTKVRRRLFEDAPPLCSAKLEKQKRCILQAENDRFENEFNFSCRTNKPLKDGMWDWQSVDSKDVPSFYTQPYIAKNPESLKKHHMSCIKNLDKNSRIYRNHFQSLATIENSCVDIEQRTTTTSTIYPVLPETPFKGVSHPARSSVCGIKRKLSQVDAESDFSERNTDDNPISSSRNQSLSPMHSHSSSETLPTTESSSQSQDSVGYNLQNTPCTTTDNNQSSQIRQNSLHAQQEKQLRQTNLKEYMKSQKSASAPVAKQARRL